MVCEFKTLSIYFPANGEFRKIMFRKDEQEAVAVAYLFLIKSGGVIVFQEGFDSHEIEVVNNLRLASGEALFQPNYFAKN
jgi:hypothetical protein